ncbi:SDR family NAD(P)-dependent oxidoreductase [Bradyrhizobium oligotrophicum]|uniref:SDR family NAD(P)-dependent oxidoreductase n=1 Tax=Bradyrhizobium oligotrophicum TaxID=44255 RepID=UPI003EBCDF23
MSGKVWFITGASRGFGRLWAEAALGRGDRVAATARVLADVADLSETYGDAVLPIALDVTNARGVQSAVSWTYTHFGRLDIVLNNAGYMLVGAVEEAHEADLRAELDTNFLGTFRVIQAALPLLRRQRSGHIIGVSSVGGIVASPLTGLYNASKFAVEALHESLAQEVMGFGIKVTLLEPGVYATGFASMTSLRISSRIDAYDAIRDKVFAAGSDLAFGDPQATADAILAIVDAETPPLRLFVGSEGLRRVRAVYADRLATWEAWDAVSCAAQGEVHPHDIPS